MQVQLTPSWLLTDEHSSSSYGQPVLVNKHSPDKTFGPGDFVRCYPNWPFQPAGIAVARLGTLGNRTTAEIAFIGKFIWAAGGEL